MKRQLDISIISDVHLGTFGCRSKELLNYIKSIKPEILILNGDIIDLWNIKKRFFPKEHLQILQHILKMSLNGTRVYYITGNHDDTFRQFSDFSSGEFHLRHEMICYVGKMRYLIFHGDQFDTVLHNNRFLSMLGGNAYNFIIRLNTTINKFNKKIGLRPINFAHSVKRKFKKAVQFMDDFEAKAIQFASKNGYDGVICGHIHTPKNSITLTEFGKIHYMNSGDWVENMTALEYVDSNWTTYQDQEDHCPNQKSDKHIKHKMSQKSSIFFKSKSYQHAEQ